MLITNGLTRLLFVTNSTSLVPTCSFKKECTIWRAPKIAEHSEDSQKALRFPSIPRKRCTIWGFAGSAAFSGDSQTVLHFLGILESTPICRLVCSLGIPRKHYTIYRKCRFPDSAEHMHTMLYQRTSDACLGP